MSPLIDIILIAVGVILGYHLYIIDCLLYAYYLHPEDETSRHLREQVRQRRYWLVLRMMFKMDIAPKRYIHKSVKFLAAFIVLGIFVVTSTTSWLSRGFVAGFSVYVFLELIRVYKNPAVLRTKYFWDLSPEVSLQNIRSLTNVTIVFLVLLTAFSLI